MRSSALTRGIVALTAAGVSAALLTAGASAAVAATPPYEPDASAVGTITFYDHTGNVITTGSTQVPFAGYAVGSVAPRSGDQQAGLVFANPNPASKPYTWYAHLTGSFTTFPVTTGPTVIDTLTTPVYTVGDTDQTLDQFEANSTVYTGTGYTGMVQVRLQTANPDGHVTKTYDDADLLIDATTHTWTEVYPTGGTTPPPPPKPDTTSVSIAAPKAVKYGAAAKITATLKDTTKNRALAGQTVSLYERTSSKASAKLVAKVKTSSAGVVSRSVKLTRGEQFQWRYAATSSYKASSSSYKAVAVTTAVSVTVDHGTIKHGKTATFFGRTTPTTTGVHVSLQQLVGKKWKTVGSGVQKRQKLPNGKKSVGFRIAHKFTKKGTYKFRVSKPATSSLSGSVSKTITEHVK